MKVHTPSPATAPASIAPYTKGFPENTEIDVALTFATQGRPGETISSIVPDGKSFTLRQHISLLPLPDAGYRPRQFDPRVGFSAIRFNDYAQPIQEPLQQRWIARHRLERVNPADPNSPIKNPIVYYIDRGIPEPVRTATRQGVQLVERSFRSRRSEGRLQSRRCCPRASIPWTRATTSCNGRTGTSVAGRSAARSAIREPGRSSRRWRAWIPTARAPITTSTPDSWVPTPPPRTPRSCSRASGRSARTKSVTRSGSRTTTSPRTYDRGSVMDYPPPRVRLDAAGNIDISQRLRRRARRVRRVRDSLGLRDLSARIREGFAPRDRRGRAEARTSFPLRRGRAARVQLGPADESLGRRRHSQRIPPPPDGGPTRGDVEIRRAQHSGRRADRAVAGAVRSALSHAPVCDQLAHQDNRRNGVRQRGQRRSGPGDAPDRLRNAANRPHHARRGAAPGRAGRSRTRSLRCSGHGLSPIHNTSSSSGVVPVPRSTSWARRAHWRR